MTEYKTQTNEQISVDVAKYTYRLAYTAEDLLEYVGIALSGADESSSTWQIRKLEYDGDNMSKILWAGGNNNFTNSWTNHASLSYS